MQNEALALNTDKKSVRGRFVIQEVIEAELYSKDSKKKRRNSVSCSKFRINSKFSLNENRKTHFYVYDNFSCMYIEIEDVLKQYNFLFSSMHFPSYRERKAYKTGLLKLPSLNNYEDEGLICIPDINEDPSENSSNQCDKPNLLKKSEIKRIESNIDLKYFSPFNKPKPLKQRDRVSFQMNRFLSMDNEYKVYSIQHVISLMFESQNFIEQKLETCCFELTTM